MLPPPRSGSISIGWGCCRSAGASPPGAAPRARRAMISAVAGAISDKVSLGFVAATKLAKRELFYGSYPITPASERAAKAPREKPIR